MGELWTDAGDYADLLAHYRLASLDVDGNGCVNEADLLAVLFNFEGSDTDADLNGGGIVDDTDLLTVLFSLDEGC